MRLRHQEYWFTRLDLEQDNIRSAMAWALSGHDAEIGLRTVAALRDYWWYQGLHSEGWHWISNAMEFINDVSAEFQAELLQTASSSAWHHHDVSMARRLAQKAVATYQELNNQQGVAWSSLYTVDIFSEDGISQNQNIVLMMP